MDPPARGRASPRPGSRAAGRAASSHSAELCPGYTVSRGASSRPRLSVARRSSSSSGHGASGLTWSIVTGETPPQSSIPASSRAAKSSVRFGGACTATSGGRISRAAAIVHRSSSSGGSGAAAIRVPGFARKFWTITSWTWGPAAAIAASASSRSARVSPIPIRIPVVNGTFASPASRSVSRRSAGSLSGEPKCGPPRRESRSETVSSIIPIEAATGRSSSKEAASSTPGLRWGRSDVSARTAPAAAARYSTVEL